MTEAVRTKTGETADAPAITFTDEAAERLQGEIDKQESQVKALRLVVDAGGCCGYRYAMAFSKDDPEDFETVVEAEPVPLYVAERALELVEGSSIGWVENMMGAGFRVDNPNVDGSSCGC